MRLLLRSELLKNARVSRLAVLKKWPGANAGSAINSWLTWQLHSIRVATGPTWKACYWRLVEL